MDDEIGKLRDDVWQLAKQLNDALTNCIDLAARVDAMPDGRCPNRAKGGFAAAARMTPDERKARARKAASARWHRK